MEEVAGSAKPNRPLRCWAPSPLRDRDAAATCSAPLLAGSGIGPAGPGAGGGVRFANAAPLIHAALHTSAPLAPREARRAHTELRHARGGPAASAAAEAALTATRDTGYHALVPRLAALAER